MEHKYAGDPICEMADYESTFRLVQGLLDRIQVISHKHLLIHMQMPPSTLAKNPDAPSALLAGVATSRKAVFWDRIARKYATDPISDMAGYEATLRRVQELLTADQNVLEIGCGTGTTALRLAPSVQRMLATDFSKEMIAIAHEKLAAQPVPQLSFALADADAPVFGLGTFDVALAFNVLHLVADLDGAPELLVDGPGAQETAWRDWTTPVPDMVEDRPGGFEAHGVLEQIDTLLTPRVALQGGGHMMIEPTRALVAVDVNSGPDTSPAASLKANIAAARDLPRQLRLRGLGGQIVVDFAPITKKDRAILDQVIKAAFRAEGESNLAGWTTLGLYELTRKRDRLPLAEVAKGLFL